MNSFKLAYFILILFSSLSWGTVAAPFNEREYKIKAAFIANFIRYTQWKSLSNNSFRFCSVNADIHQNFIKKLSQETWFNLKSDFKLVTFDNAIECDILFIDKISVLKFHNPIPSINVPHLLIVSENRKGSQRFSHINFFFTDNKLRFEVNVERLEASDLSMHASLLRLARITSTQGGDYD